MKITSAQPIPQDQQVRSRPRVETPQESEPARKLEDASKWSPEMQEEMVQSQSQAPQVQPVPEISDTSAIAAPGKKLDQIVEGPRKTEPARSTTESSNSGNAEALAARQIRKPESLQAVNSSKSGSQSGMNDRQQQNSGDRSQYLERLKDTLKVA